MKIKLKVKEFKQQQAELKSLPNVSNVCKEKFLETRNQRSELEYKNYKNLFKTIKNVRRICIVQN